MIQLEVCANSVTSAKAAQDGGASRVELCDNLHEGGTTASAGQLKMARKLLHIKLYALIRPRTGDFLYSDLEFEVMKADIRHCIEAGCDGIVVGILNVDGRIDKERCAELVRMTKQWGLGATFHRAFDMCADQFQALEDIIDIGFERILTSGGRSSAMEGVSTIRRLVDKAAGRISIMPGSGVTENNAADLVKFTGVKEVHASARVKLKSKMHHINDHIILSDNYGDEYAMDQTDAERVKKLIAAINK